MAGVRLCDIAARLGVSVNTVSHALKNMKDISAEMRKRVQDEALRMGYRPNLLAQRLVLKKTHTIGIAVTESSNPIRMEFCEKLRSKAEQDGYRLLQAGMLLDNDVQNRAAIGDLMGNRVDAMVIGFMSTLNHGERFEDLFIQCRDMGMPVLLFGDYATDLADVVVLNYFEAGHKLTEALLERGYRDIHFWSQHSSTPRYLGYCEAMKSHGLVPQLDICEISFNGAAFKEKMDAWLESHGKPPQAVITHNDTGAAAVMASLRKHGFRIPNDCAVAGFDNIVMDEYLEPSLTSVGYDMDVFTEVVWKCLLGRIIGATGFDGTKRINIPFSLDIRGSC